MKNKKILISLVFVVLVIIIVVLSVLLYKASNNKVILYSQYNNNLIDIKKKDNITSYANILYDDYVAVFSVYDIKETMGVEANIVFYDADNKVLDKEKFSDVVQVDGKTLFMAEIPDLGDKYAGKIMVDVSLTGTDYKSNVDMSKITFNETHNVLESSELLFNIQGVNNTGVNLKDIVGAIVLLKDDLVVGQTYFNTGNVAIGAQFNASYKFPAEVHGDMITPLEFDEAFVYLINAN